METWLHDVPLISGHWYLLRKDGVYSCLLAKDGDYVRVADQYDLAIDLMVMFGRGRYNCENMGD